MGISYGVSIANIYLLEFDNQAINHKIKPLCYNRFLDDIFLIFIGTTLELLEYETFLNSLIPDIKITFEYSTVSGNFLDTTIYKQLMNDDKTMCTLQSRVYFKPTDTHQLLHKDSFHPKHTTKGILKSQLITI